MPMYRDNFTAYIYSIKPLSSGLSTGQTPRLSSNQSNSILIASERISLIKTLKASGILDSM
jgi:hypothetical protein